MDVALQIVISGLTLGAMYAVGTIGLALIYGSLNMLNMAHGAVLVIGGYVSYSAVTLLGFPPVAGIFAAVLVGALLGVVFYWTLVHPMLSSKSFEINIIIATIGIAIAAESMLLNIYGGYPFAQPLSVSGVAWVGIVAVPYQNMLIFGIALVLMAVVAVLLTRTRMGRAIRATADNKDAARLMGVPVTRIYVQVMALSSAMAAASGVLISSITTLSPGMGSEPMLKAFIICVLAGLGRPFATVPVAIAIGLFEATVQFTIGTRFAFPILLLVVIVVLIWRPYGIFNKEKVERL